MNPETSRMYRRLSGVAVIMALLLVSTGTPTGHAAAGDITRVSVDSVGAQANDSSKRVSISADGRFVAFESDASNLISGDTNAGTDIFLRDRQTGATSRVSLSSTGTEANNGSAGAAISADGRFVAFTSDATNLVPGDTNGMTDIFVRDRQAGTTTRVSVSSGGGQANDISDYPISISADGRFIVFNSDATNLVPGDTNESMDVFLRDNQTGITERVSVAFDGTQANGSSVFPSVSANGRYVAFTSGASNLVTGDTNNKLDVFVRDRQAGTTTRSSINSSGIEANLGASDGSISGDGRFVAFSSSSTNLMTEETSSLTYVYVHDRQTGLTSLVSVYPDGYLMVGRSYMPSLSFDGRYVAFEFDDRSDGTPLQEIFIRDRLTGLLARATRGGSGGEESSFGPKISSDGRVVAYWSVSNRLVSGDTNGVSDAFVYEVGFGPDLSPTVVSITPNCGFVCTYPTTPIVEFRVIFSEAVTGVTVDDFALFPGGAVTGATITSIRGSGSSYAVTIDSGTGDGSLRLDLIDNDSIQDVTPNPLGGIGAGNGSFSTGGLFVIDKNVPFVTGIHLMDGNPTASSLVHYAVAFSEPVTGVDVADFSLSITGGITGAGVMEVTGSGTTYSVTASTGTGDGTIRLDLFDNDSIVDQVNNPLGGPGTGSGSFTGGEAYTINRSAPIVISIVRSDSNPTAADPVHFTMVFSEAVGGVDAGDFGLTNTGNITGAGILSVNGSGSTYIATVGIGSGNGTIRLDLLDNDSILDEFGLPLGGFGAGNGNFTIGEVYTINKVPLNQFSATFSSNGTNDGWVLESAEDSNLGATKNAVDPLIRLGDDKQDRQYRAILHFPTFYLPDNAVVTGVILMIKSPGSIGTSPFTTHGGIAIDIRSGVFGKLGPFGIDALQASDFQNPASMNSAGVILNTPNGSWYSAPLTSPANQFINLRGATQFRLAFQLDDNDNRSDDYLVFYSGNADSIPDRPHLVVTYYLP